MRDTSQISNYDAIIQSGDYQVETKVNLAGIDYFEGQLKSVVTTPSLFSDIPSVGNCYSAEIDVVMEKPDRVIPRMAMIRPYVRLVNRTMQSDWIPQGVFFIDTREETDNNDLGHILSLHGYDAMLKAEAIYPVDDVSGYPQTDLYVVNLIARTMGIEVDQRTYAIMVDQNMINLPATYTMREVLGYIGSMYAGNWCISFEGKLRLIGLADARSETRYLIDEYGNAIVFGESGSITYTETGPNLVIVADDDPIDSMTITIACTQDGSGDPSPENIRPIHGYDEANIIVSPYRSGDAGTTYTISFSSVGTVYNGTLNVTTGVLTITSVGYTFDGTEDWTSVSSGNTRYFRFRIGERGYAVNNANRKCSHYPNKSITSSTTNQGYNIVNSSSADSSVCIRPDVSTITSKALWKSYLADQYSNNTPVQCVADLAEAETYNLTPTEIETFMGTNYIHTDTNGNITMTWTVNVTAEGVRILV